MIDPYEMTTSDKITDQIATYIVGNLDKPLDVKKLSDEYQVSRFTLQRKFKKRFHQTIHQYALEKRLLKAHSLLTETNKPVKEITAEVGFKSLSSFTRKFHQRFHITPAELRSH